ncbi:MAG: hypothetical protein ABFS38_09055 [Bacteroidota bacterium]
MKTTILIASLIFYLGMFPGHAQHIDQGEEKGDNWDRTREILKCAPRLVDRRDLVEDNFEHRYITNNPRDIEVGYFSVEPITYFEEGRRFCEASLPVAGVSASYFRGTYKTMYTLPGEGVYRIMIESNALMFNNEVRIINAQNTFATIEASHRLQIISDTSMNREALSESNSTTNIVYTWEVEVEETGAWQGTSCEGDCNDLRGEEIPVGTSSILLTRKLEGPGVIIIQESVIFQVEALSTYKYDPIFQAASLFSLEPLSISAKLLPCEE